MIFFQNTWVVGIITGIISGVAVSFFSKIFVEKKENTEYKKQIKSANLEVISALKPYIADNGLPEFKIFRALIFSVSRRHCVQVNEMYTIQVYCEELIREVMCDVYIPNNKKKEYTEELASYIQKVNESKVVHNKEIFIEKIVEPIEYREKINESVIKIISILTAILTAVTTIFTTKYIEIDEKMEQMFWFPFENNPLIWIAILMAILSVGLVMIISVLSSKTNYKQGERNNRKEKDK